MRTALACCFLIFLAIVSVQGQATRLESLQNKTILVFTPHPDDDVFGAGGTIALLNRNHNKVYIVVYTNDDKGSYDPEMSSERLARIRRAEQEISEGQLGTPKENILWMGYDDGMLEYAPQPKLTEEATAIIRRIRPDVLLSVDPGEWYERWHKTDHRMAAFNTIDAVRAAEFWLYFPNQRLQLGLEPYQVPEMYFFYPSPQESNYFVNIDSVAELKFDAASKQFRADLTAQTPRGPVVVPISGRVSIRRSVPILARRLEGGSVIGSSDLDTMELPEERITADVVTDPQQLVGRELRRDTPEGGVLRSRDVMPQRLVQRGSLVTMKIETPYILVTAQGKAQQDGAEGETIRVMNTQSNRIIEGVVIAPGVVEIVLVQKLALAE